MRAAMAARLAELFDRELPGDVGVVMLELTDPAPGVDRKVWDRTCDRCGTYVEEGGDFYTGSAGSWLLSTDGRRLPAEVVFGLCADCTAKETGGVLPS